MPPKLDEIPANQLHLGVTVLLRSPVYPAIRYQDCEVLRKILRMEDYLTYKDSPLPIFLNCGFHCAGYPFADRNLAAIAYSWTWNAARDMFWITVAFILWLYLEKDID